MSLSRINVDAVYARFEGSIEQIDFLSNTLAITVSGAEHTPAFKAHRWDGKIRLFNRRTCLFLSGLTWRVVRLLKKAGFPEPEIEWPPIPGIEPGRWPDSLEGIEFRPYQLEAIEQALRYRRIGLQCPTGSGKSEIGFEIARQIGLPTLWVTHREALLEQTQKRAQLRFVGQPDDLIFGMVQTLHKLPDTFFEKFNVVIFDEGHHLGAETWQKVAAKCINAHYRIALSGTLTHQTDRVAKLKTEGATGPIFEVAETMDLAEKKFLATPHVKFLKVPLTTYPTYESVREQVCPNWRDNPKQLQKLGHALFANAYTRGILNNDARTRSTLDLVSRHIGQNEKVLVLCTRVPHADALSVSARLRGLANTYFLSGDVPNHLRDDILHLFRSTPGGAALFATPFFREGMDVPEVDVGIIAGADLSDIAVIQWVGRMLRPRPDKNEVLIYDFLDGRGDYTKDYLYAHTQSRLALYKKLGFIIDDGI